MTAGKGCGGAWSHAMVKKKNQLGTVLAAILLLLAVGLVVIYLFSSVF
jgi:hypothetical protein